MFREIGKRAKKAGQPPGTLLYNGDKKVTTPSIRIINYKDDAFYEKEDTDLDINFLLEHSSGVTWVNVEGLQNIELIKKVADHYQLHSLTIEDILNNDQRPKVEEFDGYLYITAKMIKWSTKTKT